MKLREMENYQNEMGLKGCTRSSCIAPGTESPLSHSFLEFEGFSFPTISPMGELACGGMKLAFQYEVERSGNLSEQNGLKELQMIQFEGPRH